jgi:hypothetical protein
VRLVLANKSLVQFGGSESYLITVAEELQRLGHEVTAYAPETGDAADVARDRGIRVASTPSELPGEVDGALAQDGSTAYELAERYRKAVRLYVAHSNIWIPQRPPQLPDVCHAVVALNDTVKRQCEALAVRPRLVRLRQPINGRRFRMGIRREQPQRVLAFGNVWVPDRFRMLAQVCAELELELDHVGPYGRMTPTPELDLAEADIVVGVGRCILEAMASQRAAYVYGLRGGDGWVTPESYPALEADGFAGSATDAVIDLRRMRSDLEGFKPAMGEANRDLTRRHHDLGSHASGLVELFRSVEPHSLPESAPLRELARLVRVQWESEMRASEIASKNSQLVAERDRWRAERDRWHAEYEHTAGQLRKLHDAYNRLIATRRWRFAQALGTPLDLLRRLRARTRARADR